MRQIPLAAQQRETTGKGAARKMRATGLAPAVIYRGGQPAQKLSVKIADYEKVMRQISGDIAFLSLTVDNQPARMAVMQEIQTNYLGRDVVHLDFYEVRPDQKMTIDIPVEIAGEAKGEEVGGITSLNVHTVKLEGLIKDIPDVVSVDVSGLELGQSLQVADLKLPDGVTVIYEDNYPVAGCHAPARASLDEESAVEGEAEAQAEA